MQDHASSNPLNERPTLAAFLSYCCSIVPCVAILHVPALANVHTILINLKLSRPRLIFSVYDLF